MSTDNTFKTPVGRIVGGSLSEQQTTGFGGKEVEPNWMVYLAVPKSDPGLQPLLDQIKAVAAEGFADSPQQLKRHDFAWKFHNGDSDIPNQNGKAPNSRDGWPGHIVFSISNKFAFQTVSPDAVPVLIDAASVTSGDWVRILGKVVANGRDDKPGVYLNLNGAQLVRHDDAVVTGAGGAADAVSAFATSEPAHDIVTNVAGPPPPPPATPAPVLTAKGEAAGTTVAQYFEAGWSVKQLEDIGIVENDTVPF